MIHFLGIKNLLFTPILLSGMIIFQSLTKQRDMLYLLKKMSRFVPNVGIFWNACKTRERPRTDGKEGLRVLQILNYCQEALESRCRIVVTKKKATIEDGLLCP